MPNGSSMDGTAADHAYDAAQTARQATRDLAARLARLEELLVAKGVLDEDDLRQ